MAFETYKSSLAYHVLTIQKRYFMYIKTNQETKLKPVVMVDGVSYPYVIAETRLAKQCVGLLMIQNELTQTMKFISLIDEAKLPDITQALWHAAIMSYARCFTDAKGRGSRVGNETINSLDKDLKKLHFFLMKLRNEYVAHAGNNTQGIIIPAIVLNPIYIKKKINMVYYFSVDTIGSRNENYFLINELCAKLLELVNVKKEKAERHLLEIYQGKCIDDLYKVAIK